MTDHENKHIEKSFKTPSGRLCRFSSCQGVAEWVGGFGYFGYEEREGEWGGCGDRGYVRYVSEDSRLMHRERKFQVQLLKS